MASPTGSPSLLEAREARRRAEQDEQLLANRIALLRQEEGRHGAYRKARTPAASRGLVHQQQQQQRILVNFSISKNSMALGTRPLERVPNNVS